MYKTFEELECACRSCLKCELGLKRTNLVFGVGKKDADVMFIGEGPGENEDLQGEPFVGKGGQLLDKYLNHIGLSRQSNIYIANMVKCRPPMNRDPSEQEQAVCLDWLRNQILLIRPKIIVCLGRISAQKLIDPNFKVTRQHGIFFEKRNFLMMGTFHPAALLRNPAQKGAALQDFMNLRDKITQCCPDFVFTEDLA